MSDVGSAPPVLAAAETGSLVLTDISGYTTYLLGTELEHAQDVLSDLTSVVVSNVQPPLTVSKLEGDAVFSYDGASFERTITVPVERTVAWEWLTAPERRVLYAADDVVSMTPGGRQRTGVTNHCMHGPDVIVEHIADWRPFDYFTKSYDFPGVGRMSWTFELVEDDGRTTLSVRGEPLDGERSTAWAEIGGDVLAGLDDSAAAFVNQMDRVARPAATR